MHTHTCVICNVSVTSLSSSAKCAKGHPMKVYTSPRELAMALAAEGRS